MELETDTSISGNYVTCDVNFGDVAVGETVVKSYELKHNKREAFTYMITRSRDANPIYHVFDVSSYEGTIQSNQPFVIKIRYSPTTPDTRSLDYFNVLDNNLNLYKLCFHGYSLGPHIKSSVKYLYFVDNVQKRERQKTFQLTNIGDISLTYQFEHSESDPIFQVLPRKGTIKPRQHVFINVQFTPQEYGFFSKQLPCLILYHEPILIHLFGIYANQKQTYLAHIDFRQYPFPLDEAQGFKGYLSDAVIFKTVAPPISLSEIFVDFGRIIPGCPCQILTTSLTNHFPNEIEVEWCNEKEFSINPEKLTIPGNQSVLYDCKFNPEEIDRLYGTEIHGKVTWKSSDPEFHGSTIPIPITFRMIGHTFPSSSWIPEIALIPETVILPVGLPQVPSYATLMIKSYGHLPVLFKLLPPRKTSIIMKPMVGLVRDYQIIVVQLHSRNPAKKSYIEKWAIELNGQVDKLKPLYVKGQTDLPCVLVGTKNVVDFGNLQANTQAYMQTTLKNISNCIVHFQFIKNDDNDNVLVDPDQGYLNPIEEVVATWWLTTGPEEGNTSIEVKFSVQFVDKNQIIGPPCEVSVTLLANSVYSELCAVPKIFEAGEIEYKATIETEFTIFNFGSSAVHFLLVSNHRKTEIKPDFGTVGPVEKLLVSVKFHVHELESQAVIISYCRRINEFSSTIVPDSVNDVFTLTYQGFLPKVQITDITEHNFGHLFSKQALWTLFRIDDINRALYDMGPYISKAIDLNAPELTFHNKTFYVILKLENTSEGDVTVALSRIKMCVCEQSKKRRSLTFSAQVYDCPHKSLLEMSLDNTIIKKKCSDFLTLKFNYLLPGKNILTYTLSFNHHRTLRLNTMIHGILNSELSAYNMDYVFDMGFVYIGLKEAPVQGLWLYNSSPKPVMYHVEDIEIVTRCNQEGFPIFSCLNTRGIFQPDCAGPILFRFWPIEVKTYTVVVTIKMGAKKVFVKIFGNGTDKIDKYTSNMNPFFSTPTVNTSKFISLSATRLQLEPMLVSSFTERLMHIKNVTKESVIEYKWKPYQINGIIQIEVIPSEGKLKPSENSSFLVKIQSLSEAALLQVALVCQCTNTTQMELHLESKLFHEERKLAQNAAALDDESIDSVDAKIIPCPETGYSHIIIAFSAVGYNDRDTILSINQQFKRSPSNLAQIDVDEMVDEYFNKKRIKEKPLETSLPLEIPQETEGPFLETNINLINNTLECMIADTVFCDFFKETIKVLDQEPIPLYSQIKMKYNRNEIAKQATKELLTKPQLPEIASILKSAAIDSIHEVFKLGPSNN